MTHPFWILSVERSGSTLVSKHISYTINEPIQEFYHHQPEIDFPRNNKVHCGQYYDHWKDYDLSRIVQKYPDVVFIRTFRRDVIAQAVSLLISKQLDIWNADTTNVERTVFGDIDDLQNGYLAGMERPDTKKVYKTAIQIRKHEWVWLNALKPYSHISICYEDYVSEPLRHLNSILAAMEVPTRERLPEDDDIPVRLSPGRKQQWTEEIREELRNYPIPS